MKLGKGRPIDLPVELDQADREILAFVLDNELTMASRERLFATLMACRYVCDECVEGDFVECGVWRDGNSLLAADVFRRLAPARQIGGVLIVDDYGHWGGARKADEYFGSVACPLLQYVDYTGRVGVKCQAG